MSRSYRKPYVKDPANSRMKRVAARVYRHTCRQITYIYAKHWVQWGCTCDGDCTFCPLDDPEYQHRHVLVNQYDICDFRFYCNKPKYYRK